MPGEIPGQKRLAWLLLEFKSRFPYNKPYGVENAGGGAVYEHAPYRCFPAIMQVCAECRGRWMVALRARRRSPK